MSTTEFASDSEDEFDWEEVAVPTAAQPLELDSEDQAGPSTRPNIEVTLEVHPTQGKDRTQYAVLLVLRRTSALRLLQEETSRRDFPCRTPPPHRLSQSTYSSADC